MEVMGLMLGEFVDDYTVQVIDVFAMPQSGTVSYHNSLCHFSVYHVFNVVCFVLVFTKHSSAVAHCWLVQLCPVYHQITNFRGM